MPVGQMVRAARVAMVNVQAGLWRVLAQGIRIGWVLVACLAGVCAQSQTLESVLMPGKVIEAHAKLEADCNNCHVRLSPAGQSKLCADCHKEVGADIRDKVGYHGKNTTTYCRSCHTDHRGRNANIVKLSEAGFDHGATDFALKGKHKTVVCASCHAKGVKHRKAPGDCASCHRKDDRHKGSLGKQCESCHNASSWKDTHFDHNKTAFGLQNKHAQAKCGSCHLSERYEGTPKQCVACHRKDDAHRGNLGASCERCHNDASWKQSTFRHEKDAHYPLRDSHATLACKSCHEVNPFQVKTSNKCVSCHLKDDRHKGTLGNKCESCHSERKWNLPRFDHDRQTQFPLKDKHQSVKCEGCHQPGKANEKVPSRCADCHAGDDMKRGHKGNLGQKCESCHTERGWTQTRFRHDRDTSFPLKDKHQAVKCNSCHQSPLYQDKTPTSCASCHHKEDVHKGSFGGVCDKCHSEQGWKTTRFDHDRDTAFRLEGAHAKVVCKSCHLSREDGKATLGKTCLDCHTRDDVHFRSYGDDCQTCHATTNWKSVSKRPGDKAWPFQRTR